MNLYSRNKKNKKKFSKQQSSIVIKKSFLHNLKQNKELLLMNIPTLLLVFVFSYLPMIGIILAFKNYRYDLGILGSPWVGFENFKFLFTSENAWRITRNTVGINFMFIIITPIFYILFALLLNEVSKRAIKVYQTIMFFPHYLSWVVVSYLFIGLFDMEIGLVNNIIKAFGSEPIMWYSEPNRWPLLLLVTHLWKVVGYGAVIYYTVIIGINNELYEAAEIDGANRIQQTIHITIPLLIPTVIMLSLISIGNIFKADFGMFYFLTQNAGALYPTTDVIDTYVFRTLRVIGDMGMGTAVGLYQGFVGLVLVTVTNFIIKKADRESAIF